MEMYGLYCMSQDLHFRSLMSGTRDSHTNTSRQRATRNRRSRLTSNGDHWRKTSRRNILQQRRRGPLQTRTLSIDRQAPRLDRNYRRLPTLDIHQPEPHSRRATRPMGQAQEKIWRGRKLERIRGISPIPMATTTAFVRSALLLYRVWNRVHGCAGSLDTLPQRPESGHLGLPAGSCLRRLEAIARIVQGCRVAV